VTDPLGEETADWTRLSPVAVETGCLLVATPLLDEAVFRRSVVYVVEHSAEGSLGVVLNRPTSTPVAEVLPPWGDLVAPPETAFEGGPVQQDGALCLADSGAGAVDLVDLDGDPEALRGSPLRVFVGYAGWSPGQLDDELAECAWWAVPGSVRDVFTREPWDLWARVLRRQQAALALVSTYPDDPTLN
jgi:putative transcriptional regulator